MFAEILRFWLDRGIGGFRVDMAHGLLKDPDLADAPGAPLLLALPWVRIHRSGGSNSAFPRSPTFRSARCLPTRACGSASRHVLGRVDLSNRQARLVAGPPAANVRR